MKLYHMLGFVVLLPLACGHKEGSTNLPATYEAAKVSEVNGRIVEPSSDPVSVFKFKTLLNAVGQNLPDEVMRKIETEGSAIPGVRDILTPGDRSYVFGDGSDIVSTLYISTNRLISIGYMFIGASGISGE